MDRRGEDANRNIMALFRSSLTFSGFFKELARVWEEDDLPTVAGALTYFGFLSIFPFLLFLVALASLIITPTDAERLIDQLRDVAPPTVADILGGRIQSLAQSGSPGLLTIGALGALWVASGAMGTLMSLLNRAYDVKESRPFWKVKGLSVIVTIIAAILLILATMFVVAAPAIVGALSHLWDGIGAALGYLGYPIGFLFIVGVLVFLYYALPDVKQKLRFLLPGAVLAGLLWLLVSFGFSLYVRHFGNYEATYGTLGGIIIFLVWMYLSSLTVLIGAEVNAIVEHSAPEGKRRGQRDFRHFSS